MLHMICAFFTFHILKRCKLAGVGKVIIRFPADRINFVKISKSNLNLAPTPFRRKIQISLWVLGQRAQSDEPTRLRSSSQASIIVFFLF